MSDGDLSRMADELGVLNFQREMRDKLEAKRLQGRSGWDDPDQCSIESLWELLEEHVQKRQAIDIGNFAMMIWNREEFEAIK